ncbi:hypothetical protein EJ05DRAFT_32640 [Pseudovirgaria hyperparasitica]|uniref:DNA-directed RNA polymerase subunit n=1 Tax=Pseudovirgaria hyperparasitica TaxID=470096 RepID=A0A6A6WM43_9PEZI|nr:uncharacterized protein EJ05DRAFT_32640 [Pseudovirgaria hyperparasitica]KAF2763271.1 hypothetical protein EJ05DRAFT_32640 [Pseudovirgaria hyperparasitica]
MSDSPTSNPDEADQSKKIAFRFCSECSNLLYPKEDKINARLMFACRTCQYATEALTPMVTRKEVSSSAGDTAGLTDDIGQDPTLPRVEKLCPKCGENEAVFFQSQQRSSETGMKLYYVCCTCGQVWQDATPAKR